jgi:hypothetical protein
MQTISMSICKKRLAILWSVSFLFLFIVILMYTVLGRYNDKFEDIWSWLTQNTLPTMSLIVSTFVVDVLDSPSIDKVVDEFYFKFCYWGCFAYLSILIITILSVPVALDNIHIATSLNNEESMTAIIFLKKSNFWLSPFQALVNVLLGVFFIKKAENAH